MAPFGSLPKISTPVENTVENRQEHTDLRRKTPIFRDIRGGEALSIAIFRASAPGLLPT